MITEFSRANCFNTIDLMSGSLAMCIVNFLKMLTTCNKSVKIRLVATCHLQDLLQLVETTCSKTVDNKF